MTLLVEIQFNAVYCLLADNSTFVRFSHPDNDFLLSVPQASLRRSSLIHCIGMADLFVAPTFNTISREAEAGRSL